MNWRRHDVARAGVVKATVNEVAVEIEKGWGDRRRETGPDDPDFKYQALMEMRMRRKQGNISSLS